MDVLVVGGGPAGRTLAVECARRGLRTRLVDRAPGAPWRATYGAWAEQLPAWVPVAARARGRVVALTPHVLDTEYAVIDVPALRAHLDAELSANGVDVVAGSATGLVGRGAVRLADGTVLRAHALVDAGGWRQPLRTGPRPVPAEQTAYGLVVPDAAPLVAPGEALFMDWRRDHGERGWPTFLYGVPLGGGRTLLEETSLARRPGLPLPLLERRLRARLARHGIAVPAGAAVERVRFPVDPPRHRTPGAVGFGAAAPLVHPATGFSLAAALRLAPSVAAAIADGGSATVWSRKAIAVHRLRRIGLEALLRMPAAEVPSFFEVFFQLPARHRAAYLDGRDDLAGVLAAMGALARAADWRLRYRLISPAVLPPVAPHPLPPPVAIAEENDLDFRG
ncbi:lycopene cyclase family protein [Actinomycetes bacterium KLBMP 9759]